MRIELKSKSERQISELFEKTKGLIIQGVPSQFEDILKDFNLDIESLRDGCRHGSYYEKNGLWILYYEFDDEFRKIADQLSEAFDKQSEIYDTVTNEVSTQAINENGDVLDFPAMDSGLHYSSDAGMYEYLIQTSLSTTDDRYLLKKLNSHQVLDCIKYWHQYGNISYPDMYMTVGDMSSDGEVDAQDFEQISGALLGVGRWSAHSVHLSNRRINPTGFGFINAEIIDCVDSAVQDLDIANFKSSCVEVELSSSYGLVIKILTSAPLNKELTQKISDQFKETKTFSFIDRMYQRLFQAGASVCTDVDYLEKGIEDAEDNKAYYSITELLKAMGTPYSAVKANKILLEKKILKEIKLRGTKTPKKVFFDNTNPYGINVKKSDKKNDYEARFMMEPFRGLVAIMKGK